MKNGGAILKWASLAAFILAFAVHEHWVTVSFLSPPYHIWLMVAAMGAVLFLSRSVGWLGLVIFGLGLALQQGWINFNFGQISFNGVWLMAGGFLTSWLSTK